MRRDGKIWAFLICIIVMNWYISPRGIRSPWVPRRRSWLAESECMRELSPETSEFIHFMMENELFDVLGYKDKKAGGYMTFLPTYQSPFVFANFNGTSGDTDVLTHECGHAFQGYLQRKGTPAERDLTMETAEIHSMSMEFFTEPWMKLFYDDERTIISDRCI